MNQQSKRMFKVNSQLMDKLFFVLILVVLVTAAVLFLKRSIYPDTAFDTVNYHFFLGKEGVENFPNLFKINEFYPLGIHDFNPAVDMLGYCGYLIMGYRLGTIFSLIFYYGLIIVGYKITKELWQKKTSYVSTIFFCILIVPIFIVNEGLFQLASYFTDNVYAFLAMLSTAIVLKFSKINKRSNEVLLVASLGLSVGLLATKLTNIIYVIPLSMSFVYLVFKNHRRSDWKRVILLFVIYGLLILFVNFFLFLNIKQSGNPVFPFYNSVFKSEYFPEESWEFNFGPTTVAEKLLYPAYAIIDPVMLGEGKDIFPDLKLIVIMLYVILAHVSSLINKEQKNRLFGVVLFIFLSSAFLWQFLFGYARYAIYLEMLGGIVSALFVSDIFLRKGWKYIFIKTVTILFAVYMIFQSYKILAFNYKYDISWRPTATYSEWKKRFFTTEIFRKYTEVDSELTRSLDDVDFIIQCMNPSSAYFSTIQETSSLPMLNFDKGSNMSMTGDPEFIRKRDGNLLRSFGGSSKSLNFVSIYNKNNDFIGKEEMICRDALNNKNVRITNTTEIKNFIGEKNETLSLIFGTYNMQE